MNWRRFGNSDDGNAYIHNVATSRFVPPVDEAPSSPVETRHELLGATKRGFTPVRHIFVQTRRTKTRKASRGSTVAKLVRDHQERAFDAYLMVLALEPILGENEPLHSAVWGRLMSNGLLRGASISRTWGQLEHRGLIVRERRAGNALVRPRREDGKAGYARPGRATRDANTGGWPLNDWYFVLPHAYWTDGWDQRLRLPGKAMLLVSLQATSKSPSYWMRLEDAPAWYGVSAETAQRGLAELEHQGLLRAFHQRIKAPRSPTGFTTRTHYTLAAPFSPEARRSLQAVARRAFNATVDPRYSQGWSRKRTAAGKNGMARAGGARHSKSSVARRANIDVGLRGKS